MIKVFYCGYGLRKLPFSNETVKRLCLMAGDDGRENAVFYLPPETQECLEIHGIAYVNYLMFERDNYYNGLRLIMTDKDDKPSPFTITKGQDKYNENGNALRLIFDDAPIDDVAPTEKELSESKENGYLLTIGAMLTVFADSGLNQVYLTNEILKKYIGIHGLGRTSIDTKFSNANAIFNEKLKEILEKYKEIHGLGKTSIDTKFSNVNAIFNEKLKVNKCTPKS